MKCPFSAPLLSPLLEPFLRDIGEQQAHLLHPPPPLEAPFSPPPVFQEVHTLEEKVAAKGKAALSRGEGGCLLIAGGQGSRLGFGGPKGLYPLTEEGTTLFELWCRRILTASEEVGVPLPLAVMTSPLNHSATESFFQKHHFFGLDADQVQLFSQPMRPLLTLHGEPFLGGEGELAMGPDGNGSALWAFVESGVAELWQQKGVNWVNWVLVDNLLAHPFDPWLLGYHQEGGYSLVVKCIRRADPDEKVGVFVEQQGALKVVEYSELPSGLRYSRSDGEQLLYPFANISLMSFSLEELVSLSQRTPCLPWHVAKKASSFLNERGERESPQEPNSWKFERFIFDCFPFAKKIGGLCYPRERCFAPLKNREGKDSPQTVRAALVREGLLDPDKSWSVDTKKVSRG